MFIIQNFSEFFSTAKTNELIDRCKQFLSANDFRAKRIITEFVNDNYLSQHLVSIIIELEDLPNGVSFYIRFELICLQNRYIPRLSHNVKFENYSYIIATIFCVLNF